jgi:hypothetical protein
MVTNAELRATAKWLCFRACTDCKSADECDPDENWIKEARASLELESDRPSHLSIISCRTAQTRPFSVRLRAIGK